MEGIGEVNVRKVPSASEAWVTARLGCHGSAAIANVGSPRGFG